MRNKYIVFFLLLAISLISCSKSSDPAFNEWEDGYKAGYSDGKFDSGTEHEDDYSNGYNEGFWDASSDYDLYKGSGISDELASLLYEIELMARHYANTDSDYDLESALDTVDSYLNGTATALGEWPTKTDFEEAARYLYNFSDFYYSRKYDE